MISSKEIRESFQRFFEKNQHLRIKPASIVPENDPTLLFINSGMAPLKPYFTGEAIPPQKELCNVQPCIRTIDIDDVGDRHHLTLFEMLGSWSIGGYFKKEAIHLAYDLLVNTFKFNPNDLVASVYKGNPELNLEPDHESAEIWRSLGFDDDHIVYQDHADNFWGPAGETGPCGPCTEVFYDTGSNHGPTYQSGGHFDDSNRYIEIWNAGVFMELNKEKNGTYTPLKFKSVDTGSGLERLSMVLNQHETVYETDLFAPLIKIIKETIPNISTKHERILADHFRAFSLMLAEGIFPSNEGKGYISRRLIRKCLGICYQYDKASLKTDALFQFIQDSLGTTYPQLIDNHENILTHYKKETEDFNRVLEDGMTRLQNLCVKTNPHLSGDDMFSLVSTYGFPVDLIREYVIDKKGTLDESGYEKAFQKHQALSRQTKQSDGLAQNIDNSTIETLLLTHPSTPFTGYDKTTETSTITSLIKENNLVNKIQTKEPFIFVSEISCFYAESGGQIGDNSQAKTPTGTLTIHDTKKTRQGTIYHFATLDSGFIETNQTINLAIDSSRRASLSNNHSATHLLQSALRNILGTSIKQAGSLVEPHRLRFDFFSDKKVDNDTLFKIDQHVNQLIQSSIPLELHECSMEEALKRGAIAFFEDKYGDRVRVVQFSDQSIELCGGTHVKNTRDIHAFKILSESSVGKELDVSRP